MYAIESVLYLISFGLLTLTAGFLISMWAKLAWKRAKELNWKGFTRDQYMVLATSLCLSSLGTGFVFGARTWAVVIRTDPPVIPFGMTGWVLGIGMLIMIGSKFGFMWAAYLSSYNKEWGLSILVSLLWVLFSIQWIYA